MIYFARRTKVIAAKMCLLASPCPSHVRVLESLNGFLCNLIVCSFTKNCQLIPSFGQYRKRKIAGTLNENNSFQSYKGKEICRRTAKENLARKRSVTMVTVFFIRNMQRRCSCSKEDSFSRYHINAVSTTGRKTAKRNFERAK
jgi:hypothetical protein